jgi:hypothetical protein
MLQGKEQTMTKDDFIEPEQQQKKGRTRILFLAGLLLVVGIGLLAWQVFARQTPQTSSISNNPHFSAQSSPPASKSTPPEVANVVRQQVAQKLHLSVDQLTTRLQSGVSIEALAAQQGMTPDEWRTFVIATYQAAFEQAVNAGKLTQARAERFMHSIRLYPPDALDNWVTMDCLATATG